MILFLAVMAFAAAMYAQFLDVKTTNAILAYPGGYEKNKLMRALQAKFARSWGTVKMGVAAEVMLIVGALVGPAGVIAISIPFIGISVRVIINNRRVIRKLTAIREDAGR